MPFTGVIATTPDFQTEPVRSTPHLPYEGELPNAKNIDSVACGRKLTIRLRPPAAGGDFG